MRLTRATHRQSIHVVQHERDRRRPRLARGDNELYRVTAEDDVGCSYQSLRSGDFIRLLILHPGGPTDPIHCSLEEADLGGDPEFDALSYCWGDPNDTQVVCCDGLSVRVTRSLCNALARLRKLDVDTTFWADAICINQKDIDEVNSQVQLMGRIYSKARQCMVWLGPSTDDDVLAFHLLGTIDRFRKANPHDRVGEQLVPDRMRGEYLTTPGEWVALSMLLARPWFERLWTLQEIVLARQATIVAGKFTFDAASFYTTILYLQSSELAARLVSQEGGYLHSLKVASLRGDLPAHAHGMDLLETLRGARDRITSDPRDKVMGVLGLCETDKAWSGTIGYHMTARDIYISVATHLLSSLDPFRVFSACSGFHKSESQCQQSPPTWVPDWSQRIALVPCMQVFEDRNCSTGGSYPPVVNFRDSSSTTHALTIRGAIVTRVEAFVDMYSDAFYQDFLKAKR